MHHTELTITPIDASTSEIAIALLSEIGYESFIEETNCLKAYLPTNTWNENLVKEVLTPFNLRYTIQQIAPQNWNALWESSFEPVKVNEAVAVHASFHAPINSVKHNIIITPKMSFGTGHHSTTHLMLQIMSEMPFHNKKVLDYGCGTGVLAIYAEKLGAAHCNAIDIDTWCIENTLENIALNNASKITTTLGDLDALPTATYDVILANINLHILQKQMKHIANCLNENGSIIISGILSQNQAAIDDCIAQTHLIKKAQYVRNEWLAIEIHKAN